MRGLGLGIVTQLPGSRVLQWSPGVVVMPAWCPFSCASARTVQTSLSTVLRGIATNQACASMYGLQHEPQSTNYCGYSENFSPWGQLGSPIVTGGNTDPAGGTTAADVTSTAISPYGGIYMDTTLVSTTVTVSGWLAGSVSPNIAQIELMTGTFAAGLRQVSPAVGWAKFQATYSGASADVRYVFLNDGSHAGTPADYIAASRAKFAFIQKEALPYATSYIPTVSASAVTRAASIWTLNPGSAYFGCRIGARMELASTAGVACTYLCNPTGTAKLGFDASGHVSITSGNTVVSSAAYTWAVGDTMELIPQFRGQLTTRVQVRKNGVAIDSVSITNSTAPSFAATGNYIGTNQDGSNRVPANAWPHLELL